MVIDKSVKEIYSGKDKIIAVKYRNQTIWGHTEEKLNIKVRVLVTDGSDACFFVVNGIEYKNVRRKTITASKTEFTFIVKAAKNSKYTIFFRRRPIVRNEKGSPEGKKYTVTLDESKSNEIIINF